MSLKDFRAECHERHDPEVIVWRLSGTLSSTKESYALLDDLRARLKGRSRPVVLDLAKLEFISSAGVGIIAAAYTSAVHAGVRLALAAVPKQAEMVLKVVNLTAVVACYATEDEAVAALGG